MLSRLIKLTTKSTHGQHFHAALVMRGGAVIASGFNHQDIHAEYHALSRLWPNERAGTVVWSIRVSSGGNLSMAKPCLKCMEYMSQARVKSIVYSDADGKLKKIRMGRDNGVPVGCKPTVLRGMLGSIPRPSK